MITIKYDRYKNNTAIICGDMTGLEEHQPIKVELKNIVTGEIHFEVDLYSGMWASWVGAELITDIFVRSKNGNLLKLYKWDVTTFGDEVEKALYFYHLGRRANGKSSNGLVIGTHDGKNGHWIYSIKDELSRGTLVEGSETQFSKLQNNYKDKTNVKMMNQIVTPDGGEVDWYQGGEGYTDTVVPELINEWLEKEQITKVRRNSVSINDLMNIEEYDWIHLDVEGIDAQLILSLEKKPNVIVFESMNLSEFDNQKLSEWFVKNLYTTVVDNGNTIAIKSNHENK